METENRDACNTLFLKIHMVSTNTSEETGLV
jgi:hypothetical protein